MSQPIDIIKNVVRDQDSNISYSELAQLITRRCSHLRVEGRACPRAGYISLHMAKEYVCSVQGRTQITVFIADSEKSGWFTFHVVE